MNQKIYLLDARTKDNKLRLSAFAESIEALVLDFRDWLKDNSIPDKMVWYSDLFELEDEQWKHFASCSLIESGVVLDPAPKGSKLTPFGRKRPLRYLLHNYS